MDVKVRFRYNKTTGEVETFDVEDQGPMQLPEAEHNALHDNIAADLGRLLERDPRILELLPGAATDSQPRIETRRMSEQEQENEADSRSNDQPRTERDS